MDLQQLDRTTDGPGSLLPTAGTRVVGTSPNFPTLAAPTQHALTAKQFCRTFAVILVTSLLLIAACNYLTNPLAQYSTKVLPPVVHTSRQTKLELFHAAMQRDPPQGLILGSSRVMKFEPAFLEQLTGKRFFNAGVHYATMEDALAFVRYYRQQSGRAPQIVVLGIDEATFAAETTADVQLLSCATLSQLLPDVLTLGQRLQPFRDLLNWTQTKYSLQSIIRNVTRRSPANDEFFRDDGLLVYERRERERALNEYDFESALQVTTAEYRQKLRNYGELSVHQLRLFEQLAQECAEYGTELVGFVTTWHPRQIEAIAADTNYEQVMVRLRQRLDEVAQRHSFALFDFSSIASYQGDAEQFVDGIHPLEANTQRMIREMYSHQPVADRAGYPSDAL